MCENFNILPEILSSYNINNKENALTLPLSQSNPKNISDYQNSSYYSFSPRSISFSVSNEPQKIETPKMHLDLNLNQNNESSNFNNSDNNSDNNSNNKINNKSQSLINLKNSKTKFTTKIELNEINEIIPTPIIHNIVSTVNLGCQIFLKEIALQAQNSVYTPHKFSALIMRIKEPKATALIFSTGKMVCLGTKNEEQSINACKRFGKIIKNLNYPVTLKEFKIINILSSCDVKFKIPLYELNVHILKYLGKKRVNFEPDIFPGLIYHCFDNKNKDNVEQSDIVFLVFKSGKIVITGAKKTSLIFEVFNQFYPVLRKFKDFKNK